LLSKKNTVSTEENLIFELDGLVDSEGFYPETEMEKIVVPGKGFQNRLSDKYSRDLIVRLIKGLQEV